MTKTQVHYELTRPIDDALMEQISSAHRIFGMLRVQLTPSLKELVVDYDASRLTPAQVEAALHHSGIPAQRKV
jgi:hypothetical protein